ncbi:response regulator [Cohnella silvisoli]|uniref:Response regulator n=1 Tax=Cohnella silvisoli TaxID=2873699 RepID=A0ABV1L1Y2_9BACL|nr:response regulator [Cohnella silvisoli]MCD9025940.1 response regulator [Cohnella silvisoli]
MYRLLIVDDEPIIVEGLSELFQQMDLPLEVYQAYDGQEALDITRKLRMDIVLTDIEMPELNGIELQREVIRLWPRCKVIFLTGYNDFDYIQTSIRAGAVDYVLKTEGDSPIVAAVVKAISAISEEVTYDQLISNARSQLKLALPTLRKEYLTALLQGEPASRKSREEQFAELSIPLDANRPVVVAVGRIDRWRDDAAINDKPLFTYSVHNIFEEFFAQEFTLVHLSGEHNRLVWLMQPEPGKFAASGTGAQLETENLHSYMLGTLESVQMACSQYLKLVCSFVVSSEPYDWESLSVKYDRLSLLFERGLGLGSEMLLSDERTGTGRYEQARSKIKRIRLLDHYLVQKDKDKFYALFDEIMDAVGEPPSIQSGLPLEIFYELTAIYISHMNRLEVFATLIGRIDAAKLFAVHEHASWREVGSFFRGLTDQLFALMTDENEQETNEVVDRIHEYVEGNLEGDLSLNRLSEHVYLTPFYLSRLYKQKTGHSISDYITTARVDKAKQLLGETPLKIHEVGMRIGYDSASYFTRFFKKATLLTPQEFRDSLKKK